jgi:hypothetical protein
MTWIKLRGRRKNWKRRDHCKKSYDSYDNHRSSDTAARGKCNIHGVSVAGLCSLFTRLYSSRFSAGVERSPKSERVSDGFG